MRISGRTPHDFISGVSGGVGCAGAEGAGEQISIRIPQKQARLRRGRNDKGLFRESLLSVAVFCLLLGLSITIFAFYFIFSEKEIEGSSDGRREDEDDYRYLFNNSVSNRELRFGQGSVSGGKDSRYWDKDDRRRDGEYDENDVDVSASTVSGDGSKRIRERLYDEGGRNELKKFEEQYKESLHDEEKSGEIKWNGGEVNSNDEYDDGIDNEEDTLERNGDLDGEEHFTTDGIFGKETEVGIDKKSEQDPFRNADSLVTSKPDIDKKTKISASKNKPSSKGRKHRTSCGMKLMDVTKLLEPITNNKSFRFSLQYKEIEERPTGMDNWEPRFAGHQSRQEREDSFYARDQKINCGFVKGPEGSPSTGFDLAEDDVKFMSSCHIAVSSCIFGNSDHLRTPYTKMITRPSRKNVCFVMFMDEYTLQALSSEGQKPDSTGFIGLWKIVVVSNLPYADMRRVGKIPKFLTHRLFPSARYSIWLDSKLRLQSDPLLILEYFLWRKGHEYAISNHYDRHCVWEEVAQNKKLNKFNHTIIDQQFEFYQSDGLKRFDSSDPNRLLSSYVPEGSFIMRAHTPMSNLFSCLWFNEVERFTPRDQLSFAYTYLKLRNMNPDKPFHLNLFKDCERRSIAKLYLHRGENKRLSSAQVV